MLVQHILTGASREESSRTGLHKALFTVLSVNLSFTLLAVLCGYKLLHTEFTVRALNWRHRKCITRGLFLLSAHLPCVSNNTAGCLRRLHYIQTARLVILIALGCGVRARVQLHYRLRTWKMFRLHSLCVCVWQECNAMPLLLNMYFDFYFNGSIVLHHSSS